MMAWAACFACAGPRVPHSPKPGMVETSEREEDQGMVEEKGRTDHDSCPDWGELWTFDDPAGAEQRFRERAFEERRAGRSNCQEQALTQVARAQGLQRKFAEGHRTLDELGETDRLHGRSRAYALLERGRLFNSAGERDAARPLFERAFAFSSTESMDDLAVDAAHMVAIALMEEPALALSWNEKALDLCQRSSDPRARRWKGSLLNNIGWTEFDLQRYEDALTTFVKLEELRRVEGKTQQVLIARYSQGKTLRKMGKTSAALQLQEELLSSYEKAGLEASGYVYEELGECKLELGTGGHQADFQRAHEELSKDPWLVDNEAERLERLERLSR